MALGLAMVMLLEEANVSAAEIADELKRSWPGLPPAAIDPADPSNSNDTENKLATIFFRIGDADVVVGKMPVPIPWSELEGPCGASVFWENAAEDVKRHTLHWIVTVNAEMEPVPLATLLTQVTSVLLKVCPTAIGVYWGNATMVLPADLFVEFAQESLPDEYPLPIWIDFRVGRETARLSAGFTAGMAALGHMELETQSWPEEPSDLRDRFVGLAGYLIEHGPVIRDGDTIGATPDEKIRIVYSPSAFGHEGQVMRLEHEASARQKPR